MKNLSPSPHCRVERSELFIDYWEEQRVYFTMKRIITNQYRKIALIPRYYNYCSDGRWYIDFNKEKKFKVIYGPIQNFFNNLTARQRKHLKRLKARIEKFLSMNFTCEGCVYKNKYLLTNDCEHEFRAINDM